MSSLAKKFFKFATVAVIAVSVVAPAGAAYGQSTADLQAQINALLQQIATLQAQLAGQGGSTGTITGVPAGFTFTSNLSQGDSGNAVMYLQKVLNSDSATQIASSGAGSPGNETQYFGPLTRAAVVKFQEKYAATTLAPWGLTQGTGFVGTTTREKLNELLAGSTDPGTDPGTTPPPTAAGTLSVSLASNTPGAASIADGANANFTRFNLTAGGSAVNVNSITVTRTGLSANSDVENIKIVDANGVKVGSIGTLNSNSKAKITFSPALTVPANTSQTYYIRAGIADGTTAGKTVALGIASAADIESNATSETGLPVTGNAMSVVGLTIGTVTVAEDGTTSDSAPSVGDTDVIVNKFKVTAGSTEAVTIEQITAMEAGSASLSDTQNIELFDVTNNQSLGTVSSWTGDGKASWTGLNISVAKGATHRFRIQLDVTGGSGLTVNADVIDGGDTLMNVKGQTYGFYITPTVGSWNGSNNGQGANNQTVASGALTVAKSASTPATGSVAQAADQKLASFDFIVAGEEMKITSLKVSFDLGTMTDSEISNIKLVDSDGNLVAGPNSVSTTDYTANGTTYEATATFTDVLILPVGTNTYSVEATIATATTAGDTVKAAIADPDTDLTTTGLTTNNSIDETPAASNVEGNTMTVNAGSFSATTLGTPAARSVAVGSSNYVWMHGSLSANTSAEDVIVSSISIANNPGTNSDASEIQNVSLWADLNAQNSARGDKYETQISTAKSFDETSDATEDTLAFTLSPSITVPKGLFVEFAVVGNLSASASTGGTNNHQLDISSVTASGSSTGTDLSDSSPSGAGQEMTVSTGGDATLTVDSSSPAAKLVLDSASQVEVGIFRVAANNVEDLDLDSVTLAVTGSQTDAVSAFYLYSDSRSDGNSVSDPISVAGSGATAFFPVANGTVTIPADGEVKLTVKVNTKPIDGTTIQNADSLQVSIDSSGDVDTTGLSSGNAVDPDDVDVAAAAHVIYDSYPMFAVNSASPSGNLIPAANTLLAIFDVTAVGDEDIVFDSDNHLKVQLAVDLGDDSTADELFTLKDVNGTTLASPAAIDVFDAGEVTFAFEDNTFTVPAGQTKSLYVYGDTTEFSADGESIQLWLDGASAADIDWSIGGTGEYNEGDKIFKGSIYAGSLVNP